MSASELAIQADKAGIADDAVSIVVPDASVYVPLEELIDFEQEIERLTKEEEKEEKRKRSPSLLSIPQRTNNMKRVYGCETVQPVWEP